MNVYKLVYIEPNLQGGYKSDIHEEPSHELIYEKLHLLDFNSRNKISISLNDNGISGSLFIGPCSKNRLYIQFRYWLAENPEKHSRYVLCEQQYVNTNYFRIYEATIDGIPEELEVEYVDPSQYILIDQTVPHEMGIKILEYFIKYGKFPVGTSFKGSGEKINYWIDDE